jgi:hypothetical protein
VGWAAPLARFSPRLPCIAHACHIFKACKSKIAQAPALNAWGMQCALMPNILEITSLETSRGARERPGF